MNAKNFRLGNLVYDTEGKVNIINLEALNYFLKYGETKSCQAKSILLTEEWLLKFGFRNVDGEYLLDDFRYNLLKTDTFNGILFCDGIKVLREVRYVHQLQNLFFALTGKELEIQTERVE